MGLTRRASRLIGAAVVAATAATLACRDEPVSPSASSTPPEISALSSGIHPILSIPGLDSGRPQEITHIRVHLFSVGVTDQIGAYQGVLRYDPKALEVVDGAFADGAMGAWNIVEPGVLRFAGADVNGIGESPAIDLTVRAQRTPAAKDFQVQMEEVVGAGDFHDLTSRVDRMGVPILTAARLGQLKR